MKPQELDRLTKFCKANQIDCMEIDSSLTFRENMIFLKSLILFHDQQKHYRVEYERFWTLRKEHDRKHRKLTRKEIEYIGKQLNIKDRRKLNTLMNLAQIIGNTRKIRERWNLYELNL